MERMEEEGGRKKWRKEKMEEGKNGGRKKWRKEAEEKANAISKLMMVDEYLLAAQ